jgi:hypothetical protein
MADEELPAGRALDEAVAEFVLGQKRGVQFGIRPEGHDWEPFDPGDVSIDPTPERECARCHEWSYSSGHYPDGTPTDEDELCDVPPESFSGYRAYAQRVELRMFADGYQCNTNGSIHTKDGPWHASFAKGPSTYHGVGAMVEIAICRAALKAVRAAK